MLQQSTKAVACIGFSEQTSTTVKNGLGSQYKFYSYKNEAEFYHETGKTKRAFNAILSESIQDSHTGSLLKSALNKTEYKNIPFGIITDELHVSSVKTLMQQGVSEVFLKPLLAEQVEKKLKHLVEDVTIKHNEFEASLPFKYKLPLGKRLFDIFFATGALLVLSPVFLLTFLLVKLTSKGPAFYYSLRVGTGYKIFRFYKFRSMAAGADAKLSQLKHLNQYAAPANSDLDQGTACTPCDGCENGGANCPFALYSDNKILCEKKLKAEASNAAPAFVKIKDDPRITRIGKFIRKTSIDELPQLWNVLKGDMSVVGNRPLPLYEAEKLTTDRYALRFIAPAGITGLWQVSKRGKGNMSEDERISLDNDYAKNYGLLFDVRLILKTIPALLQKENV